MPRQPDMFAPALTLKPPAGANGPRLWVRRLTIWQAPGGGTTRDIALRPGLNIVWSPDGTSEDDTQAAAGAMGHGSGKTLFCRLLRYCLGEDRFAPEGQRERIATAFPDGIVGAEIVLDGVPWAILRPLGLRRRHMAVPNGNLDQIAAGEGTSTGLEPFLDAIEGAIMTQALADLIPGHRQDRRTWPIALAWLTRDQECRFDGVLDWRSRASDSDSPARGLNETEKLDALRAFLCAITAEEHGYRRDIAGQDARRTTLESEIGHRQWEIGRLRSSLAQALGVADDGLTDLPLAIDTLRQAANNRLSSVSRLPQADAASDIASTRREYAVARADVDRLNQEISGLNAQIDEIPRLIAQIKAEIPGLSYAQDTAARPICPICEVPIDSVLASQCGLSHKVPDLDACRQRFENRRKELAAEEERLRTAQGSRDNARRDLAIANQTMERVGNRLQSMEKAREDRNDAWYQARRLVDRVARLSGLMGQQDAERQTMAQVTSSIDDTRRAAGALRDQQARVLGRLNDKFDAIIRYLVGGEAQGRVTLTGNGLDLTVRMGGDRSTAAIDSLKVIAFDLAALCLGIEGQTRAPAFVIHDSPREADLGLPLYHRLFGLGRFMEGACGATPHFQYIVTTTTRPPDALARAPWLIETLRGAPADQRLMRCDL